MYFPIRTPSCMVLNNVIPSLFLIGSATSMSALRLIHGYSHLRFTLQSRGQSSSRKLPASRQAGIRPLVHIPYLSINLLPDF